MIITIGSKVKDEIGNEYELIDEIGSGGFGCVFQAKRISDNQLFAVKTLTSSFPSIEEKNCFMNEIKLAQTLSGEHIIQYEYFHDGEKYNNLPPYIIMEYAKQGTLENILDQRKKSNKYFELNELIEIYKQLINAMININKVLVHRDIKPANILINNNILKVTDFGLSKMVEEQTRTKTFKGGGTYYYMSPECWNYDKNTIQMDIYSMGIIFYELATLEYPYKISTYDEQGFKSAHVFGHIQNSTKLQKNTNPQIASIIIKMLDKARQNRFDNWEDILKKLEHQNDNKDILGSLIQETINIKNDIDIATQKRNEEVAIQKMEKETFINLAKFQFESDIITPIQEYIEQYNESSSTNDKAYLRQLTQYDDIKFKYKFIIPSIEEIIIECKIILKNSFEKEVPLDNHFEYLGNSTKKIKYTPTLKSKEIICFVEIKNSHGYGFNLLLLKSNDIYGDWYIANNKNNLSHMDNSKLKKEPFAFPIENLKELIISERATSWYSSELKEYNKSDYYDNLRFLISKHQKSV